MENTAQNHAQNILVTEVDSEFGANIAKYLLASNKNVWGVAKKPPPAEVLENPNFTLLDIDLTQPIPSHLATFDLIIHLMPESTQTLKNMAGAHHLTGATNNIITQAKHNICKVILMAPLSINNSFYEHISKDPNVVKNLRLFVVGDIYSPKEIVDKNKHHNHHLPTQYHFYSNNELTSLISQAVTADKIILEDEGMHVVIPTYIDDAMAAFAKFFEDLNDAKKVRVIVSESPTTALSSAYEVQKVAQLALNKDLKLYFSGPERKAIPEAQPLISLDYLGFEPKVKLEEGLRKVFESKVHYHTHHKPIPKTAAAQPQVQHQNPPPAAPASAPEPENKPQKRLTLPIPRTLIGLNTKRIILGIVMILILTILKTGLDIYWGVASLKSAKTALNSGDFDKATASAKSAEKSFSAAGNKYKWLSLPLSPIFPGKRNSIASLLTSAQLGANSVQFFASGAKDLAKNLKIITSTQTQEGAVDPATLSANFKKAYLSSIQAYELAQIAVSGKIFPDKIAQAKESFQQLSSVSSTSLEFINFMKDLTGTSGKKTYLILLLNNAELRPGGGFIGSYGEIAFDNGHLKDLNIDDIYNIDGQLKEKIEPPKELTAKLGVKQLYLRDSNWSPDFAADGATARDFYKKETGREVDGVIALDLTFIQNLLEVIGPIKLDDYNEQIDAKNLFERGEYHAEVGFTPGSTQKKDFFSSLAKTLINKIIQGFASVGTTNSQNAGLPWLEIINSTRLALSGKHVLLSFDNKNLSSLVRTKGWDNSLPPTFFDPGDDSLETRDILALSEANLGANKANRDIERKVNYEMTVDRDAGLVAKLKITYTNHGQANTWPAGTYVNFLKVYAPAGAGLIDYQNGTTSDLKAVEVTSQANLAVFSTFVEVPVKETKEVTFTYRIPKNIKLEQAPTYQLYISKQPGTGTDPLTFTFNLPNYIEIKSVNQNQEYSGKQNIKIETDLATDRQFQIEVKKK